MAATTTTIKKEKIGKKKETKKDLVTTLSNLGCKTSFPTKAKAQECLDNLVWFQDFPWHDEQQEVLHTFNKVVGRDDGRDDANDVCDRSDLKVHHEFVVQGIFGNGKTTLMLGLFFNLWWNKIVPIEEMGMCAFNICIKNELIRRLRSAGIKKRPMIRTFDSFIYSIALSIGCPDLDKPNYEGRRKFVETWIRENDLSDPKVIQLLTQPFPHSIKWMFIDEAQDLEGRFYDVLRLVFPHANFIFFGDVFQCIQKEPRTCLLWHVLRPLPQESVANQRHIFMMKKTPRVPPVILTEIRSALSAHYPEYTKLLSEWTSLNTKAVTEECKIHWKKFKNYKDVFQQSLDFIHEHGEDQVMILVFSSAITVRGGIGDVARFRHFYKKHGVKVNSNYKRLETDKLFLSTVNSSKGLERPHVFLILTFPLELAFANFSNDLVVNLVSVGLSRCKHQVVFSVPIYKDRHSRVLELYKDSPQPDSLLSTISRSKGQKEQFASLGPPGSLPEVPKIPAPVEKRGYTAMGQNVAVFLEREHSTTEILRQSIVSYDTRLHCLSEYTRRVEYTKLFPGLDETFQNAWRASFSKLVTREEERALVGILMEQLMNTVWTRKWPSSLPQDVQNDDNPLFMHCKKDFVHEYRQYTQMTVTCSPDAASPDHKLQALYHYSRCHLMIFNKVCVSLSEMVLSRIKEWFRKVSTGGLFKETISGVVEESNRGSLKLQHNLKMACMTGIADGFYVESGTAAATATTATVGGGTGTKRIGIIEIKGCPGSNWHEEALYQSFLYFIMANKSMGTIILLNPVRNEKLVFNVWIPKYYSVRISVFQEILLWNTNCFFAKYDGYDGYDGYDECDGCDARGSEDKTVDKPKDKTESTNTLRTSSLEFPLILVVSVKDEENKTRGATVIRILATTKIDVLASAYSMTSPLEVSDNPEKKEDETTTKRNRTKSEKLEDQSIQTPESVEKMIEKTCRYFPEGSTLRIRVGFNGLKTEWEGGGFDKIGVPVRMKNRCVSEYLSQMNYGSVLPTCPLDWQDHFVLSMMFSGFLRPFLC